MQKLWLIFVGATMLAACMTSVQEGPVAQMSTPYVAALPAPQTPAPTPVAGRRITYDGQGAFVLPDGSTVAADPSGGFTLPNGAVARPDGTGGVVLPNGTRCSSDGARGYVCP